MVTRETLTPWEAETLTCQEVIDLLRQRARLRRDATDYGRRSEAEITEAEERLREFDLAHPAVLRVLEEAQRQ